MPSCRLAAALAPLAALALLAAPAHAQAVKAGKWTPIFDGRSLDGWTPKIAGYPAGENYAQTFVVQDGAITVSYAGYDGKFGGKFGHLFYKESFSHYRLRVEYRFVGDQAKGGPGWAIRNSGVMIHGESPATMAKDQDFPASIEVQLLGGGGQGERPTANLCTPGTNVVMNNELITRHCTNSKSKTYRGDQWVTVEIEAHGSKLIRHLIDGEPVLIYNEPQLDERDAHAKELAAKQGKLLEGGTISLQSESHPVHFRKVELMTLGEEKSSQ